MTTHGKAYCIIDKIKLSLLNIDLNIARAENEINLNEELIDLYKGTSKRKELAIVVEARIKKENFVVFKNRLIKQKKVFMNKIKAISQRYNGIYSDIFMLYFFEDKQLSEISEKLGIPFNHVRKVVTKLSYEIIEDYTKKGDI